MQHALVCMLYSHLMNSNKANITKEKGMQHFSVYQKRNQYYIFNGCEFSRISIKEAEGSIANGATVFNFPGGDR